MKVAYGLAGVGRGHTMRASSLGTILLKNGYDVQFFSCCDSTKPLTAKFGADRVHDLPTPQFSYNSEGRLKLLGTALNFTRFMAKERKKIITLSNYLKGEGFEVVISDYEPLLAKAANHASIPLISFNSQGFVNICTIPLKYKTLSLQVALANAFIIADSQLNIVSKPIKLPTKTQLGCLVGPMIRPHIQNKRWIGKGNHILVYMRPSISKAFPSIVKWGQDNGLNIYVYGDIAEGQEGLLESPMVFVKPISETQFIDDMITSQVVISTAGTQLIGEVAYLGAPTILIPEKGQKEQELNAYLAADAYPNIARLPVERVTSMRLRDAFNGLSGLGEQHEVDGSDKAFEAFHSFVQKEIQS